MREVIGTIGVLMLLTAMGYAFLAVFVTYYDGQQAFNGLRQPLHAGPPWSRLVFGPDRLWPGFWPTVANIAIPLVLAVTGWTTALFALSRRVVQKNIVCGGDVVAGNRYGDEKRKDGDE